MREFEAFTADLYRLADWLSECGVETVVMESTGVYWIPLFGVLEERGLEVMLVDPRRIKNVPGRKTDVRDCQWLQQLHTYGLLSGAFRPDGDIRRLRSYLRQRAMLVEYASQHIQHMQKALTQMNVKLQHVIRDITGKTGYGHHRRHCEAASETRESWRELRDPRIKADAATIARSLWGHWHAEHVFELSQALELYRAYQGRDRRMRPGDRGPVPADLKTAATVNLRLPMARSEIRRTHPASMPRTQLVSDDGSGPDRDRRGGGVHGPEGHQRDRHRHDEMAQRQALRVLAGAQSQQPHHRRPGHQLKDQTQRQPGRRGLCVWRPTRCTAPTVPWAPSCAGRKPTWERPRP